MGFQSRSARVSIFAPDGKWRGEGGDLYSDLRGLARGARVSWSLGQKWTPSLGVYVHGSNPASSGATVLAYRDRFQLLPHVRIGGEVTSDAATFMQTQYTPPRLDLTAFYRSTRGPIGGHDTGVSGGLALGRGLAVSVAIRVSDAASDSSQWQLASIRAAPGAAGQRHPGTVVVDRVGRRRRDQRADAAGSSRSGPADAACSMGTHRLSTPRGAVRLRPPAEQQHPRPTRRVHGET
jgi:hypothetical protein